MIWSEIVPDKVIILFKEIGSAPALKQNKFKLASTATFKDVLFFLRKQLQVKPEESLVSGPILFECNYIAMSFCFHNNHLAALPHNYLDIVAVSL